MTATEQLMMTKDMSRMTTTTVIKDKSKFPLYLFGEFIVFLGFMFMMDNLSSNLAQMEESVWTLYCQTKNLQFGVVERYPHI